MEHSSIKDKAIFIQVLNLCTEL